MTTSAETAGTPVAATSGGADRETVTPRDGGAC